MISSVVSPFISAEDVEKSVNVTGGMLYCAFSCHPLPVFSHVLEPVDKSTRPSPFLSINVNPWATPLLTKRTGIVYCDNVHPLPVLRYTACFRSLLTITSGSPSALMSSNTTPLLPREPSTKDSGICHAAFSV